MLEEEDEEGHRSPVARKHNEIVYFGALFAGRAIWSAGLVLPTLLIINDSIQ